MHRLTDINEMEDQTLLELAQMEGRVDSAGHVILNVGPTQDDVVVIMSAREFANEGRFPIYGPFPELPYPYRHEE